LLDFTFNKTIYSNWWRDSRR